MLAQLFLDLVLYFLGRREAEGAVMLHPEARLRPLCSDFEIVWEPLDNLFVFHIVHYIIHCGGF